MHWLERYGDGLAFMLYFVRLRVFIILGEYYTANPTDIRWRWRHWQQIKLVKER